MLSDLTGELARQRIADLHAEADRWRLAGRVRNRAAVPRIILLFAGEPRRGSRAVGPTYTISPTHPASAEMEGNIMTSSTKRRLFQGVGAALAAIAMSATLAVNTAAASDGTPPAGITVPGEATGAPAVLIASLEGRNEVTGGATAGQALALIGIQGNTLTYSITWRGIGTPTEADIHSGARGVDGDVVVPLFTTPPNPTGGFASGTVTADPDLLAELRSDPTGYYAHLHTTAFPAGATRAQLHPLTHPVATSGVAAVQESVVLGSQIYACTAQPDGSFVFTQLNVEARLTGGIHHTFVQPVAGPPQWQAPDGSAVTGKVVTKNSNGAGNIAELDLDATQIGASTGLLAHVVEVLRLNTVGGVAPAGSCDPQATPTVNVPYQADYVFINGRPTAS